MMHTIAKVRSDFDVTIVGAEDTEINQPRKDDQLEYRTLTEAIAAMDCPFHDLPVVLARVRSW